MAGINMTRAFNSRMLSKMVRYRVSDGGGTYDEDNNWVPGRNIPLNFYGVILAGNKFSQFEEGEALHSEDGGQRHSDYKTLYVTDRFDIELGDKIEFGGVYFEILQRSDERVYNFQSFILEKSKDWTP